MRPCLVSDSLPLCSSPPSCPPPGLGAPHAPGMPPSCRWCSCRAALALPPGSALLHLLKRLWRVRTTREHKTYMTPSHSFTSLTLLRLTAAGGSSAASRRTLCSRAASQSRPLNGGFKFSPRTQFSTLCLSPLGPEPRPVPVRGTFPLSSSAVVTSQLPDG